MPPKTHPYYQHKTVSQTTQEKIPEPQGVRVTSPRGEGNVWMCGMVEGVVLVVSGVGEDQGDGGTERWVRER